MSPHPCSGHSCDHCYLCDVVGVCCATRSPMQRAQLKDQQQSQAEHFRQAVFQEGQGVLAFADLVRAEAEQEDARALLLDSARPALPAPSTPFSSAIPTDSQKEASYVVATDPLR